MPEPCGPLSECNDVDGKLLIQRAVYGPQLAFDTGNVALGGVTSRGSTLRTALHLKFELTWKATGLCHALPTSVMGLAPGEVVTVGLRTRSAHTFSNLVRNAAETTRLSGPHAESGDASTSIADLGRALGAAAAGAQGAGATSESVSGTAELIGSMIRNLDKGRQEQQKEMTETLELMKIYISAFGSSIQEGVGVPILVKPKTSEAEPKTSEDIDSTEAVNNIDEKASDDMVKLAENMVGDSTTGPAVGMLETMDQIAEIIDAVERSESESSLRETTVTTTTESEQTITRTFGNPYLDRSLQLRFIPVFQRFEVSVRPVSAVAALAAVFAEPDDPPASARAARDISNMQALLAAVGGKADSSSDTPNSLQGRLSGSTNVASVRALRASMLSTLQNATQASGVSSSVRLDQGLAWDRTTVVGNAVHVPLADGDIVARTWRLASRGIDRFKGALARLRPDAMRKIFPQPVTRIIHVFAGLHVEAVPGSCVLPDIPEHLRVIVPAGTTYQLLRPTLGQTSPDS